MSLIRKAMMALAVTSVLTVAACSDGGEAAGGKADTLTVAWSSTPTQLDPNVYTGLTSVWATHPYLATLLAYDTSSGGDRALGVEDLKPSLAESYEVNDDKTEVVFKLRHGVKSSIGNEMTADDVVYSFERMLSVEGSLATGLMMPTANVNMDNPVEKIDEYTVRYNLDAPSAVSLSILAYPVLGILDSKEVKKHTTSADPWANEWLKNNTAGFGAYTLEKFEPGREMRFEANPNYFGDKPDFEKMIIRAVPEGSARSQLLISGDVDIISEPTIETLSTIDKSGTSSVMQQPDTNRHNLSVNMADKTLSKPKVRQAISHAIDREAIVSSIYKGYAKPALYPQPASLFDDQPEIGNYDRELAKSELAAAGYPDGFDMTISFNTGRPGPFAENLGRLIQGDLKQIGINVTLKGVPSLADFEGDVKAKKLQAYLYTERPAQPDVAYGMYLYQHSKSSLNSSGYSNAKLDKLIMDALALPLGQERKTVVSQALDLLATQVPIISLVEVPSLVGLSNEIEGYVTVPSGGVIFSELKRK